MLGFQMYAPSRTVSVTLHSEQSCKLPTMMHSLYVAVLGKPPTINQQASCLTPIETSHIVGDSNAQTWPLFGGFKPHHPPSTSHMFS